MHVQGARTRIPETRGVHPKPAELHYAATVIIDVGNSCTSFGPLRSKEAIVARELLEADGEEEGEGDDC